MSPLLRRREFIGAMGATAAVLPLFALPARAQQPMPVVGMLAAGKPEPAILASINQGLSERGFAEGRNVAFLHRAAEQYDQLAALASELAHARVAAIVASGSANTAHAAMAATKSIPIVFANGGDPVRAGLVASMNKPGGNVTGVTFFSAMLGAKRLELLRELVPPPGPIALLVNPSNDRAETDVAEMEMLARNIGQDLMVTRAGTPAELEAAFAAMAARHVTGLLVAGDAFFVRSPVRLVELAARHRIPTSYPSSGAAKAGGLMSYSDDRMEDYRQVGRYLGRILKGEKPADLPVLQPTQFEFVINRKTAKALGLTFPPSFELRATEVIE